MAGSRGNPEVIVGHLLRGEQSMPEIATGRNERKLTSNDSCHFLLGPRYVLADVVSVLCALSHNSCIIFH